MKDVYVILGAPGSGKRTQAQLMAQKFNLDFISWGQAAHEQKLNNQNPDLIFDTIKNLINDRVKTSKKEGLVVCGYPRKLSEAEELVNILADLKMNLKCVVNLNVSLETIIKRVDNNFICNSCGKVYNDLLTPKVKDKCDRDDGVLSKEIVDLKEIKTEFCQFLEENRTTYDYLKKNASYYFSISGDEKEIDVFSNIVCKLKNETREGFTVYKKQSSAILPTEFGPFQITSYLSIVDFTYHLALIKGDVNNKSGVLTRVHSSCITGDIFSSLKCDCGPQLHKAMELVQKEECGIVIYLFQEGRGINIINKINAYALQQKGLDTVEANESLGLPAEMRQYGAVKDILDDLGVRSIRLLTNNPDKISKLTDLGIAIEKSEPLEIEATDFSKNYLSTKKIKMKHKLHIA